MNDFARLKEKLAKLRERERAPGEVRKLKGADPEALIGSLVTEIDETILPRRLSLSVAEDTLHLAVANRRLQAVLEPAPGVAGADALTGVELPDTEAPEVAALRDVLVRFFEAGGACQVTARRLDVTFASDIGVPANMLGRAWGVDANPVKKVLEPSEVVGNFLSGLGATGAVWLRIEGENVADQSGDEDRVASLGEQAAIFLDGYFSKFDALFSGDAAACGTVIAAKDGEAMLFVEYGEVSAFVAADVGQITSIARSWQELVAE